eukprot:3824592-Pyramimonas_sp.AAC.1
MTRGGPGSGKPLRPIRLHWAADQSASLGKVTLPLRPMPLSFALSPSRQPGRVRSVPGPLHGCDHHFCQLG